MLCHASCLVTGQILLSSCSTTARNKGLSSAITCQHPGSAPQWVRAGMRACGWHSGGDIHPHAQYPPRDGSLHPVPPWEHHPGTWGITETLPVSRRRVPYYSPACSPGVRAQAAAMVVGCQPQHCPPQGSRCTCPALHAGHGPLPTWEGVCPPHLPQLALGHAHLHQVQGMALGLGTFSWDRHCPRPGLHSHMENQPRCQQI